MIAKWINDAGGKLWGVTPSFEKDKTAAAGPGDIVWKMSGANVCILKLAGTRSEIKAQWRKWAKHMRKIMKRAIGSLTQVQKHVFLETVKQNMDLV